MLIWVAIASAAVPFELPSGENTDDWTDPLRLGGFEEAPWPEIGPAARLFPSKDAAPTPWMLETRDEKGIYRRVPITLAENSFDREDLVWLTKSLLYPIDMPENVEADRPVFWRAFPKPVRSRLMAPSMPEDLWFQASVGVGWRSEMGVSARVEVEVGSQLIPGFMWSIAVAGHLPTVTKMYYGPKPISMSSFDVWLNFTRVWDRRVDGGMSFGPGLIVRVLSQATRETTPGPAFGWDGFVAIRAGSVRIEPWVRMELDLFTTRFQVRENPDYGEILEEWTLFPLEFSAGLSIRFGDPDLVREFAP